MEVVLRTQHNGLVLGNTLDLVSPLASDLDAGLDGFGAGVHGQHQVKAKEFSDEFGESGKNIIVESAGAQRQARGLLNQGFDQLGVTMALVHGRVGSQKIKIVTTFWIPNRGSLSASKDNGERMVVVRRKVMLGLDGFSGGRRVVGHGIAGNS